MVALATGQRVLRDYAHVFSPRKFTQPQLFACLVLKEFEKKDYRGLQQILIDCPALREAIGLKSVPHYTTLQKACQRLLRLGRFRRLLHEALHCIGHRRPSRQRHRRIRHSAVDSSGFDAHHASRYFIFRQDNQRQKGKNRPKMKVSYKTYGKLMIIACCKTHAILAAVASQGPAPDIDQLDGVLAELPPTLTIEQMAGDAGFDSADNHAQLREGHGIYSLIPPEHGRPPKDPQAPLSNKYRQQMKQLFNRPTRPLGYRLRSQVETVFSMLKRNLGAALRGRSHYSRLRDMRLRVLTHNIMLAAA